MLYVSFLSHHWASHEGWCQIHVWPHILGGCLGTSNHAIKLGSQVHVRSHVLGGFSGTYNPSLLQLEGHAIGRPNFPAPRDPKMPKIMTGNVWPTLFLFWYFLVFFGIFWCFSALLPKTCVFFFCASGDWSPSHSPKSCTIPYRGIFNYHKVRPPSSNFLIIFFNLPTTYHHKYLRTSTFVPTTITSYHTEVLVGPNHQQVPVGPIISKYPSDLLSASTLYSRTLYRCTLYRRTLYRRTLYRRTFVPHK